jgi:hypothetical protein
MTRSKLVYGVGINDLNLATQIKEYFIDDDGTKKNRLLWFCPFYNLWRSILKRSYSVDFKLMYPTYNDVVCCEEWHLFSRFREWMINQDWENKQLDKDILIPGNNTYCPEACRFVAQNINKFVVEADAKRGNEPLGVTKRDRRRAYSAKIGNPFPNGSVKRRSMSLGSYFTAEEAHLAWATQKLKYTYELIETEKPLPEISEALIKRYTERLNAAKEAVQNSLEE